MLTVQVFLYKSLVKPGKEQAKLQQEILEIIYAGGSMSETFLSDVVPFEDGAVLCKAKRAQSSTETLLC